MLVTFYMVQGLPGSGRSGLATDLAKEADVALIAQPELFLYTAGEFKYNERKLEEARTAAAVDLCCQVGQALFNHRMTNMRVAAIVDDLGIFTQQIDPYFRMARFFKDNHPDVTVQFKIEEPTTQWRYDAAECARRTTKYNKAAIDRFLTILTQNRDQHRYDRFVNEFGG